MSEEVLTLLREKNPRLPLYSVEDSAFAPYGRVLGRAGDALTDVLTALEIPAQGNAYTASCPALEALSDVKTFGRAAFGGMEIQAGWCNGVGDTLNALEYHKCSEVNCSSTGCVLLLALPSDMAGGTLDSARVAGFYLPPRLVVEVRPLVLHFAPCRVRASGFNCLVILERGVNSPLSRVDVAAPGEDALLWMRGKWMLCHPDSPQAAGGAYVGIRGENLKLYI